MVFDTKQASPFSIEDVVFQSSSVYSKDTGDGDAGDDDAAMGGEG